MTPFSVGLRHLGGKKNLQMLKFLLCKPESYKQGPVLSIGARDTLLILVVFLFLIAQFLPSFPGTAGTISKGRG